MEVLLAGKKNGVFENKKYFQLFFSYQIDDNGEGLCPLQRESFGKRVPHFSCTEEVYHCLEVDMAYDLDSFYFDKRGKIVGYGKHY